jgi:signal transduction histidine kinase
MARDGAAVEETTTLDLDTIAHDAWDNVATDGATLDAGSNRRLDANRSRLLQLLENLFDNAVEHGTADGDAAELAVTVSDVPDGFVVEDNGAGLPETDHEHVFEPGYTTRDNGTGFGLAIVKQLASAHGWTVEVEASDGGGARFVFTGVDLVAE